MKGKWLLLLIVGLVLLLATPLMNCAPSSPEVGKYVGSVNSNIYHYPHCEWAKKIKPENEIWFDSVADAKAQGYRACKVCKPPG